MILFIVEFFLSKAWSHEYNVLPFVFFKKEGDRSLRIYMKMITVVDLGTRTRRLKDSK